MKVASEKEIEAFMQSLPGKKGVDIPEHIYDVIAPVAHARARQLWGTNAEPWQLQHLFDNGHHTPEAVNAQYDSLPHPHSPSISVGEYPTYSKALQMFNEHQGPPQR